MTNDEKANEIAEKESRFYKQLESGKLTSSKIDCKKSALEMAKWKDNEFKKHNDELIDKACEMYKNDLCKINHIIRLITADPQSLIEIDKSVEEFRKLLNFD